MSIRRNIIQWSSAGALAASLALFSPADLAALSVMPMTYEEVLANGDFIFTGTVTGKSAAASDGPAVMVHTTYDVQIDQLIQNEIPLYQSRGVGDVVSLRFAGGTSNGKQVTIPGLPVFQVGDRAVFVINKNDLNSISPVVGATQGLFPILDQNGSSNMASYTDAGLQAMVTDTADGKKPVSQQDFIADMIRALPAARLNAEARAAYNNPVRQAPAAIATAADAAETRFSTDPRPKLPTDLVESPVDVTDFSPLKNLDGLVKPAAQGDKEVAGETQEPLPATPGTNFSFLWGKPAWSSVIYNIPPIYDPAVRNAFVSSMAGWNVYADLFYYYTQSTNNIGFGNGEFDCLFETSARVGQWLGGTLPPNTLGVAIMMNSLNQHISPNQVIYEADCVIISDLPWSTDYWSVWKGYSPILLHNTMVHELGHCFGRQHQFDADPSAGYHSVMNYVSAGYAHASFAWPFADDAESIRYAYPQYVKNVSDVGVHMFETFGSGYTGDNYNEIYSTAVPAVVSPNRPFNIGTVVAENAGVYLESPVVSWFLIDDLPANVAYPAGSSFVGQISRFSYAKFGAQLFVDPATPPGYYHVLAMAGSDDNNKNQVSPSQSKVYVEPLSDLYPIATDLFVAAKKSTYNVFGGLTIKNGGWTSTGAFTWRAFLSYDEHIDSSDVSVSAGTVSPVPAGAQVRIEPGVVYKKGKGKALKFKLPKQQLINGRRLIIELDWGNGVKEIWENNNRFVSAPMP